MVLAGIPLVETCTDEIRRVSCIDRFREISEADRGKGRATSRRCFVAINEATTKILDASETTYNDPRETFQHINPGTHCLFTTSFDLSFLRGLQVRRNLFFLWVIMPFARWMRIPELVDIQNH